MEFRDIRAFVEVANHQGFTKAAEHSHQSQPSLSKAVKKLEDELGVTLFDRSTRHLLLTDAGKIVYTQGQQALAALQALPNLLEELSEGATGEIKIGIPPLIGTLFFPEIARTFHMHYPNVKLELYEHGAMIIEQLLEEDKIDVGITVLPTDNTIFHTYPFINDEFILYLHHDHQLAERESVELIELKGEQFILFSKGFALHEHIINACKDAGFIPSISYESSQWDLILELVASKLGITLLPKSIFEKQNNPLIKTIPLQSSSLRWKLGVITKKNAYHSFALKKFIQLFTEKQLISFE
ncbi:LysR family transcriptional regulator [Sporosarcina sp. ACRSL]|uniref:LysR family transcriptional regulator n=1 Tax=Sporosarcina sp. ACRSL TaxID=2918215 RepID=UPI001EF739F1|nr:LysR family transcriptional regulator [Sporosarcina sp. ACRSL]